MKMHGGIENVDPVKELTAGDIIDSGAVDHSSDSDYEPPVSVESFTKSSSDIKVKMEPSGESGGSDRPNILRKKPSNPDALKVKEEPSMHLQPMVARQDSLFSCMVCQGEETVAGDVRAITAHMKNVHDIRLYICDVCGQVCWKNINFFVSLLWLLLVLVANVGDQKRQKLVKFNNFSS